MKDNPLTPFGKGEWGLRFNLPNPSFNRTQYVCDILLHIQIVKSQHPDSHLFQVRLSPPIFGEPKSMTLAVNLNHQLQLRAVEIDDEMMNRFLPHELVAEHFSPLQIVPEQHFCKSAVVSEFPGALLQISAVEDSQDNPLTPFAKRE